MRVRIVKMRNRGVEYPRGALRHVAGHRGMLVIMDVTDQGLRRQAKVARLMQGPDFRHELTDVSILWCHDGRFVLTGFERNVNSGGQQVDHAQSWLCSLDFDALPEVNLSKVRNVRPQD